jgi:hypothetical protein
LRWYSSEKEVLQAVDQLEQLPDLTIRDYTTILSSLKRVRNWKVTAG